MTAILAPRLLRRCSAAVCLVVGGAVSAVAAPASADFTEGRYGGSTRGGGHVYLRTEASRVATFAFVDARARCGGRRGRLSLNLERTARIAASGRFTVRRVFRTGTIVAAGRLQGERATGTLTGSLRVAGSGRCAVEESWTLTHRHAAPAVAWLGFTPQAQVNGALPPTAVPPGGAITGCDPAARTHYFWRRDNLLRAMPFTLRVRGDFSGQIDRLVDEPSSSLIGGSIPGRNGAFTFELLVDGLPPVTATVTRAC
jgi:hypothetical protein